MTKWGHWLKLQLYVSAHLQEAVGERRPYPEVRRPEVPRGDGEGADDGLRGRAPGGVGCHQGSGDRLDGQAGAGEGGAGLARRGRHRAAHHGGGGGGGGGFAAAPGRLRCWRR